MFTYPVSLNPNTFGGTGGAKSYDLVQPLPHGNVSAVSAEATTTPHRLTVSHQETKVSGNTVDRHLVRIDKTFTDPVKGEVTLSSYMVIVVPRGTTVVTLAEIKDQVGRLIAFEQAVGALDRILANEP